MTKRNKTTSDDLGYWNVEKPIRRNEMESADDRERSIALSVSLLQKNRQVSSLNRIRLPSYTVTSPSCQCRRSFHIFCTDLFDEKDAVNDLVNIHPAPHNQDRDLTRRLPVSHKKHYHGVIEEARPERPVTGGLERWPVTNAESHVQDKKPRIIPPKAFARPRSSRPPATDHALDRSVHTAHQNSSSSHRRSKQLPSLPQLHTRALSITDQYSPEAPIPLPRTPPSSPKTPPEESSTLSPYSIAPGSLRVVSLTPRARNGHESRKEPASDSPLSKIPQYEDYAREYLSAVEFSGEMNDKVMNQLSLSTADRQLSAYPRSLSRSGTALSVRLLSHIANRYLNIQKEYNSSVDAQTASPEKTRRAFKSPKRLRMFVNENHNTSSTKTAASPPLKSVFGFSKTASSMHFGYAADRLGLQGSFEKWPRPQSRRTPIERKHEVTTLRLVTLPLVTSR